MQIARFPPQHQTKCYCRMKRESYNKHPNKSDSNRNKKKHYFVKTRNSCCPNPSQSQPMYQQMKYNSQPTATTPSQVSTMQDIYQNPNQFTATISYNHGTNPITHNILNNKTSSSNLHHGSNPIQTFNYHSDEAVNIPNSKLFNVIYDRYDKLREIETFRAENANECISVLNQQTNHNRVPNKSAVKHVCLHRYRYRMEPTISNGRGESKCELCEKWCGIQRLKNTVASGNCCIVDRIDGSEIVNGDGTNDCKIILEVQNLDISSEVKPTSSSGKKLIKKKSNRSWHLLEQAKSLALNQQRRY